MLSLSVAALAALANAAASVLQRKAARGEPERTAFSLRLLWDLAHRPVWVAGITAVAVGFLLQAVALATGSLAAVQPVLVLELPFTIVLSIVVFRSRLGGREWLAVAAMSGGLALFLLSLSPSGGRPSATTPLQWGSGLAAGLALAGVLVWLGWRSRYARRAALLGVATGVLFGLTAALIAGMTDAFTGHILSVLAAWQTYLVIVFGPISMFLLQNTLQAGRLVAAQPGLTLTDPLLAIGWGVGFFGESVRGGPWIAGTTIGAALIAWGTLLLSRSPHLQGRRGATEEDDSQ